MLRLSLRALTALTALVLIAPALSARADEGDTLKGGCGSAYGGLGNLTTQPHEVVMYVAALSREASGGPSAATVECWLEVNGVERPETHLTATGDGLIVGQHAFSFEADEGLVSHCQRVTFADGSTWTSLDGNVGTDCFQVDTIGAQPVVDLTDAVLCPLSITLGTVTGGGVLGVLRFGADGDLYVGNTRIFDCP